jgi:hypothetical protein
VCLDAISEQLGGKALCFGNPLDFDRDGVDGLLQLIEALLELQRVWESARLTVLLESVNEPKGNRCKRCRRRHDDCHHYAKVRDIRIHCGLGRKL